MEITLPMLIGRVNTIGECPYFQKQILCHLYQNLNLILHRNLQNLYFICKYKRHRITTTVLYNKENLLGLSVHTIYSYALGLMY